MSSNDVHASSSASSPSATSIVQEQIGVSQRRVIFRPVSSLWKSFADINVSDYIFWDAARRGQKRGLELAGLFIKPVGSKISSWVLGRIPLWSVKNQKIGKDLNTWWRKNHAKFMRAYNEALDLGDCYLVFNGDASITVVSPDMVEPVVDEQDFSRWMGWKITVNIRRPDVMASASMRYEDTYTAARRTHNVYNDSGTLIPELSRTYPNPLGRIPVVHIANRRGSDELFGRPEVEGALNALLRYGDIAEAGLNGNIRQGRPTPVISKMGTASQVNEFWAKYGHEETIINSLGEEETVTVIPFDPDQLLTLGGEAVFAYESPSSFSVDTNNFLQTLFYLFLQHTEIPEFVWGNAIGSSKASAESQLEPFLKFIDKKRGEAMEWISELADLWMAWTATFNARARSLTVQALWKPMASGDGRLTLDSVIWAWSKSLLDDQMAAWLLPINLDNPDEIVEAGKKAGDARQAAAPVMPVATPAATPADGVPASGGGTQGNFTKQENPILPTQRQMDEDAAELTYEQNFEEMTDEQIARFFRAVQKKQAQKEAA